MDWDKLINAAIVGSILLAVVFFLWYLFGDSPTPEQLIIAAISPTYLFMFGIYRHLDNKIDKINDRLNSINEKLAHIGERLAKIEH